MLSDRAAVSWFSWRLAIPHAPDTAPPTTVGLCVPPNPGLNVVRCQLLLQQRGVVWIAQMEVIACCPLGRGRRAARK